MKAILLVIPALLLGSVSAQPVPAPTRLPAANFFEPPNQDTPRLSPNGTKLCLLTRFDAIHNELTLVDLATKKAHSLAKAPNVSVVNFWWKTDELVLLLLEDDEGMRDFRSLDIVSGKFTPLPDLSSYRELELINVLPADPEHMLFRVARYNNSRNDIAKVNIRTGKDQVVEQSPTGLEYWFTNQKGEAVAGAGRDPDNFTRFIAWRAGSGEPWQRRFDTAGDYPRFKALGVAPDGRRLLACDYSADDKGRIRCYDPIKDSLEEEVMPAQDVEAAYLLKWGYANDSGAIFYWGDQAKKHFLNAEMKSTHEWLERALPGTQQFFRSFSQDNSRAIIFAYNDRNPGVFCLVNFPTKEVTPLAPYHRAIKAANMAPCQSFKFPTADGLVITGSITLPPGIAKPPLLVRTGAWLDAASSYGYDGVTQFFASRGYAVARINHRGTVGYGRNFAKAGDFQVMTGMVQDVSAGVKWLDDQGWIDGKRAAVMGEQFGGLLAYPLAAQPGLFKALLTFDTPLETSFYNVSFFVTSDRSREALLNAIGGRLAAEKYAEQCSPLKAIAQLPVPSFHAYSTSSVYVSDLRSRLKKQRQPFEIAIGTSPEIMRKEKLLLWKEEASRYEAAANFLDKYLGSAEGAK